MIFNPSIIENNAVTDVISVNVQHRVVVVANEITDDLATSIVSQLLYLAQKSDEDIQLYINSVGGSVPAGMAIYDAMQYIKPDVSTVCIGHAASMAAVLLAGGAKGKRLILPHAEVMIHQPLGGMEGQASDLLIASEHILKVRDTINAMLAKDCGRDIETVRKDTDRDNWMQAREALDYGIVDRILQ